ncbi:MAG: DNA gyrase C-terminal beta-propeller domain-containing protein, partial [bacterium]|nr:DNA gyrase C-terminal beta-propeller domain-containing protein [bacterium]
IPEASRQSRGTAVINLISITPEDNITAVIPIRDFVNDNFLFFGTKLGMVKKTDLTEYAAIRNSGLIAIGLKEGDELMSVRLTDGKQDVMLGTRNGLAIRFNEEDVRFMGRSARGVKGIDLAKDDIVVGMDILREDSDVLVVTEKGYGKRTSFKEYRRQSRGGKGIQALKMSKRNGPVVAIRMVRHEDELMVITAQGVIIRMDVKGVSKIGRATQGVTIIKLDEGDAVVAVARVAIKADE